MNGQTSLQGWTIIPTPQTMQHKADIALLPMCGRINEARAVGDDRHILAVQLIDDIRAATGLEWDIATGDRWPGFITLTTFDEPHAHPSGAYTLDVTPDGVTVAGADFEGVRNGVQTLRQLIRQCGAALPCLHIEDRPAFETRGYYLDVTRGRVPTLDWLKHWADKLCLYKYNQLQLYIEHTFAFDSMSETWRGSSPLTPRDILEFDDYCAERGIELVPSVSTFGHLYMALRTQSLRDLGEFPETADEPFGFIDRMHHHTLNISDDRAFALSCRLIDDYLQLFRSDKFNICADETFDLGKGRSKPLADHIGVAAMYADYVTRLCRHLEARGRRPMMWATSPSNTPRSSTGSPKPSPCSTGSTTRRSRTRRSAPSPNPVPSRSSARPYGAGTRSCRASTTPGATSPAWPATARNTMRKACSSPTGATSAMSTTRAWPSPA